MLAVCGIYTFVGYFLIICAAIWAIFCTGYLRYVSRHVCRLRRALDSTIYDVYI